MVSLILFVILTIIVSWIVYTRIKLQINIGPFWDTYAYLANALEFAGKSTGYYELDRPPLLSFLTSIIFRLGYVSEVAIYIMDGLIFIFGVIGLYFFFNLRFTSIQSFAGCLVYVSFPMILAWLSIGYVDIAAVSFSIWALYLTVLAVKKNPKLFYLAFPMAMLAFLTRYTAGFIIFPMILYILICGNYLRNLKYMTRGVLTSFVILVPFLIFSYIKTGDPFYSIIWSFKFSTESLVEHFQYSSDLFYYIEHLSSYIATEGFLHYWIYYIIIFSILIGIIFYICRIARIYKISKESILHGIKSNTKIRLIVLVILIIVFVSTFTRISYITSEFIFFILCYVAYGLLKNVEIRADIDILFLSWLVTQFISQSLFVLKVDRYVISMLPAFVFFILWGLDNISEIIKVKVKNVNITSVALSLLILIFSISSIIVYLGDMSQNKDNFSSHDFIKTSEITKDEIAASNWLVKYDPDYKNKKTRSDIWPAFVWYLQMNINQTPTFSSSDEINHELEKNDIEYYLSLNPDLKLTSYVKISEIGTINVYEKDKSKIDIKPRILYIGEGWQHYIDEVIGLKAYVLYEGIGRFTQGESTYIDGHSSDDFNKYSYLFLYNFKWHEKKKAEELILNYAKSGGIVVIDASSNLEGIYYNLDNSIFLNTRITKKSLSYNPDLQINPEILNQTISFSPFTSDGQTWYGANYESIGDNKIENLVTANGNTLIGVQKVGNGKIIWVGYNFVWHAYHLENIQEKQLIQKAIGL